MLTLCTVHWGSCYRAAALLRLLAISQHMLRLDRASWCVVMRLDALKVSPRHRDPSDFQSTLESLKPLGLGSAWPSKGWYCNCGYGKIARPCQKNMPDHTWSDSYLNMLKQATKTKIAFNSNEVWESRSLGADESPFFWSQSLPGHFLAQSETSQEAINEKFKANSRVDCGPGVCAHIKHKRKTCQQWIMSRA